MSLHYAKHRQWVLTLVAGSIAQQGQTTCLLLALMPSIDGIKTIGWSLKHDHLLNKTLI